MATILEKHQALESNVHASLQQGKSFDRSEIYVHILSSRIPTFDVTFGTKLPIAKFKTDLNVEIVTP